MSASQDITVSVVIFVISLIFPVLLMEVGKFL